MDEAISVDATPDDCAAWAAVAPLTEGVLTPFGVLDPEALSQDGCLDLLVGLERLSAWAAAQQARVLARLEARPDPVPGGSSRAAKAAAPFRAQQSMHSEVAMALRWSLNTTAARIDTACTLVNRLPATLAGLEHGDYSHIHATALADAVRDLDAATATAVEARALPRAGQRTAAEFRADLRRAVACEDPRGAEKKAADAAETRRVFTVPQPDAMTFLGAHLPADDALTVTTAINAVAQSYGRNDARTPDQKRADALVDICAAHLATGEPPKQQGRRPAVQVTVALSTLLGLDDQPAELAGYGPVPAGVARRIAADPTGTWRRLVTDELGRLIDYGRSTYRPPADLRDHVVARDHICTEPGCNRSAARCELDHLIDWDAGGTTHAENLAAKCRRSHLLKHEAGWRSTRHPDGSTTWITPTRRTYDKPAHTYPVDTTGHPSAADPDDDPPPF